MHPARDEKCREGLWLVGGHGKAPFLCYDRLDLVRPWGLLVTGLAEVGVGGLWDVVDGLWCYIFHLFPLFFSLHGVVYGWLAWE